MILRSEPGNDIGDACDDCEFGVVGFSGVAESVCEDAEAFEAGNCVLDLQQGNHPPELFSIYTT